MSRPVIAVTMGDASGIGPEVIVKALARPDIVSMCQPVVIGDVRRLRRAAHLVGVAIDIVSVPDPRSDQAPASRPPAERPWFDHLPPDAIHCLDVGGIPDDLPFGEVSAAAGDAAFRYIERAIALAVAGAVDAICTAPISKEALHLAGHRYPGHTEILADLTGTTEVSMMLATPTLRVIHCTTHIGIIDAIERIDAGLVERTIRRGHAALVQSGLPAPRIGVCGINPHAGENGLFGRGEEARAVVPAVAAARASGIDAVGPLPADTLFYRAVRGDFDLVVAMYHDQGHGPVKVLGLDQGVNITIGLPVVRTSVDHGTAFDIAGTGRADERSLVEALRRAVGLAARRPHGGPFGAPPLPSRGT